MKDSQTDDWLQVDTSLSFNHSAFAPLLGLWRGWGAAGRLPSRSDFDPWEIKRHLGWIVLTDVERNPERYRYRLIGTEIVAVAGRDMTGRYLDELYPPDILEVAVKGFRAVASLRRPVRMHGYFRHIDRDFQRVETLQLPLASDGVNVDMVMSRAIFGHLSEQRPQVGSSAA